MKAFALRAILTALLLLILLSAVIYGLIHYDKAQYDRVIKDINSPPDVIYNQFTAHLDFTNDDTINQTLFFETKVSAESIDSLTLYFPSSLKEISVADQNWRIKQQSRFIRYLINTTCAWVDTNKPDWYETLEKNNHCQADSVSRVNFVLDRSYLNSETLSFGLNLQLKNELIQISSYQEQQIAIRQRGTDASKDEQILANWKSQLLPMGMAAIGFTEIIAQQNPTNKLLIVGEIQKNSETIFHITQNNAALSSSFIYGHGMEIIRHSRNGLDVYFIYHESQRKNLFREQRTIELILLTFDYFESILPYPDTYYWVDFATNISLGGGYAYGHGTSISTRETFDDWTIVHEVVHQWTCTLITYCETRNYIVQESLTQYLTTKILQKSGLLTGYSAYWNNFSNKYVTHLNPEYFHGKVATDLAIDVVYSKNLSLFYRLESVYGEQAFLSAIMDYLVVNAAGAKQGIKMSNDSFISHLNERFPEHKSALNHLLTTSEAFEFSLASLVQTEQGWHYGIALDYQEFTNGLAVDHAFEPWLEIAVESNRQLVMITGCILTNEGCAIVIPSEVEHTCIVVDPKNRYLALNGYQNRFCIEQHAKQAK